MFVVSEPRLLKMLFKFIVKLKPRDKTDRFACRPQVFLANDKIDVSCQLLYRSGMSISVDIFKETSATSSRLIRGWCSGASDLVEVCGTFNASFATTHNHFMDLLFEYLNCLNFILKLLPRGQNGRLRKNCCPCYSVCCWIAAKNPFLKSVKSTSHILMAVHLMHPLDETLWTLNDVLKSQP